MDVPPIHPGPYAPELLVLQGDHRSAHIWDGELLSQTLCARRVDDLWDFLRDRDLHPRVVQRLQDTGFYRIIQIGRMQLEWALITALIEQWRPETHTFHLTIGEATITLQDMELLYGLLVDGMALLTGFRPQDETTSSGASRMSLTPIRQYLEVLYPEIAVDAEELHITRYTSWGAAVLAYMYRQMCQASMGTQSDVYGFLSLLQVWAWEWFLQFQPPLPQLPPNVAPPFLPLARRWVLRRTLAREYDAHHNLPLCRDVLDLLEGA
ncbi:PREDICTED: serine/threonine-protein phosphatase 7 long form homolog [Nicotiana attenuata]|uniref:serine/threonine-protein phosphatase 7 long form homolog n=1 Tax=Nicotiana attenuata TaxID=49451 RepID=UPI000904D29A|nr:PREDICTED: serine/threonine-protein phosphatase 7 long form homolog [Nicotiana attenuata]